jgi:hypothetical protein
VGEMVHVSVLERLGRRNVGPNTRQGYAPANVIAVLDRIEGTYGTDPHQHPDLLVVDWHGGPISPTAGRVEMRTLTAQARQRLGL